MAETTRAAGAPDAVRRRPRIDTDLEVSPDRQAVPRSTLDGVRQRMRSLYPVSTRRGVSRRTAAVGVLFVVVAAALSLARVGGPGALDTIWAEDGLMFYQPTFHQSFLSALFTPNNGYLEILPRFLIGVISILPVSRVAAAMAVTGATFSSGLALLVYHSAAEHIRSRVPRACVATVTALLVFGAGEVANNIVNLQWYLLYVTFWMFLWNPQAVGRRALAGAVLFLAAASDPVSTLFLSPILLARLWCRPWRESRWQVYGLGLGLALQAVAVLRGALGTRKLTTRYSLTFVDHSYLRDVLGRSVFSRTELTHVGLGTAWIAPTLSLVALVLALVAARVLAKPRWLFVTLCLGASVELFALLVMTAGFSLQRYDAVPILLLITALAALVDADGFGRLPAIVLCVLLAGNLAANYVIGTNQARAQTQGWFAQVKDGKHACAHDRTLPSVTFETAPGGGWHVTVPCTALVTRTR